MNQADDLKARIDLRDVVAQMWGNPRYRHRQYDVYDSQWRDDGKRPAFTVYERYFKDYGGDGESGDVFTFLQNELNVDFKQALQWVRDFAGDFSRLPVPANNVSQPRPISPEIPPSSEWQRAAAQTLRHSQQYLWSDRPDARHVMHYLRHVRGLNDETIRQAGYGYNPRWKKVEWINPDTAKHVYLTPGIIEPWFYDGHLWALRVRCRVGNLAEALRIKPDTGKDGVELPKYLNLAGSKQSGALYNGDAIKPGCDVVIVEGGFDAQIAQQELGNDYAVVTLGSATNRASKNHMQRLRAAQHIYLLLDSDEAGQSAQQQLIDALQEPPVIGHSGILTPPLNPANRRFDPAAQGGNLRAAHSPSPCNGEGVGGWGNEQHIPHIYSVTLTAGKDVTDFVVQHKGDLAALLKQTCSSAWWPQSVPDSIRSALLNYFRPCTAPVIEMVNQAIHQRLIDPQMFTLNDVLQANAALVFNIAESSIRRTINELEGYFFSKLDTDSPDDSVSRNEKNPDGKNAGRRSLVYHILPLDSIKRAIIAWAVPRIYEKHHPVYEWNRDGGQPGEIVDGVVAKPTTAIWQAMDFTSDEIPGLAERLNQVLSPLYGDQQESGRAALKAVRREVEQLIRGLDDRTSTALPEGWPLSTATQYRAALLHATNDPEQRRSRRQICALLGISDSSIEVTVRRAELKRAVEEGEYEIAQVHSADNVEKQVKAAARQFRGFPKTIVSRAMHHADGTGNVPAVTETIYSGAESREYIAAQFAAGREVYIRFQVANRYVVVTQQPLPVEAAEPKKPAYLHGRKSTARRAPTDVDRVLRTVKTTTYGPVHDPGWIVAQLKLALLKAGRVEYRRLNELRLVDTLTGQILDDELSPRDLVDVLLRHVEVADRVVGCGGSH